MLGKEAETKMGKQADVCADESGLDSHPGAASPQATAWSKEGEWFDVVLVFSRASFWGHSGTAVGRLLPSSINSGFC